MQLKIFINDKLYKSILVTSTKYNPGDYKEMIQADKDAGLLNSYNIQQKMTIVYQVVK